MKLIVSAEDNGVTILSVTLNFPHKKEGLDAAHLLEAYARNLWQSSQDERLSGRFEVVQHPSSTAPVL
jgi:hypothetical protein